MAQPSHFSVSQSYFHDMAQKYGSTKPPFENDFSICHFVSVVFVGCAF
jgi:hypothetical protein